MENGISNNGISHTDLVPVAPPSFVDLKLAIKQALAGNHAIGGFKDNRGVKFAQCGQCLGYVLVHCVSGRVTGTVANSPCPEPHINKALLKHCEWTPEDQAARKKRALEKAQAEAGTMRKGKNRKVGG